MIAIFRNPLLSTNFDVSHFHFFLAAVSGDAFFHFFSLILIVIISVLFKRVMIIAEFGPNYKLCKVM